jgi:hypothetical protein
VTSAARRALAWFAVVLGAALLLRFAGTGALSAPPLTSLAELTAWVDDRGPAAAAVSVARLLAEVTAWYVLGVSAVHGVAGTVRSPAASRAADALTLPAIRRLVHAGLGVGLVAATTVAPAGAGTPERGTARMVPVLVPAGGAPAGGGTATMRPTPVPAHPVVTPAPSPAPAPPAPPATWRVEPGDSLWSVAAEVLADAWGRPVSHREIDPYWRAVVERNRPRLIDAADPDLLHPGQVLELPPPPPAG